MDDDVTGPKPHNAPGAPEGASPPEVPGASDAARSQEGSERAEAPGAQAGERRGDDAHDDAVPRLAPPGPFGGSASMRLVLVAACAVIIILGMRMAAEVVTPIVTAVVITVAISPLLAWQVRKGVPTAVAFITTVVVTLVGALFIIGLMTASLAGFVADLPSYADELQPYWDWMKNGLAKIGINVNELLTLRSIDPKTVLSTGASVAERVIGLLSSLALLALTVFFMLMEAGSVSIKLQKGMAGDALRRVEEVTGDMRAFVKVTALMGAIAAFLDTMLLLAVGVPNAVLWGILSFFLSFIPFIGFVIALIPPVLLALVTGGWVAALIVFVGYWVINGVSDNIVKPRVMGSQTNLSPLWVFLSVLLWGWVLGPIGGLLAVPVTLVVKRLVLEAYSEWHWLSVIVAESPREERARTSFRRRFSLGRRRTQADEPDN